MVDATRLMGMCLHLVVFGSTVSQLLDPSHFETTCHLFVGACAIDVVMIAVLINHGCLYHTAFPSVYYVLRHHIPPCLAVVGMLNGVLSNKSLAVDVVSCFGLFELAEALHIGPGRECRQE
jgi:hypothetical protein